MLGTSITDGVEALPETPTPESEAPGAGVGVVPARVPSGKANLRVFIDKLIHRRETLQCSPAHLTAIRKVLIAALSLVAPAKSHPPADSSDVERPAATLKALPSPPGDSGDVERLAATLNALPSPPTSPATSAGTRLPYSKLEEVLLRTPPKSVPKRLLHDLVKVARSYATGEDETLDVFEFLHDALQVEPRIPVRLWSWFPIIALFFWLALAPLVYCTTEGLDVLDAFYFAVMTMLTVGQDSVLAGSEGLKVFSIIYILVGVVILAWALGSLVMWLVLQYEVFLKSVILSRDDSDLLAAHGHGSRPTAFPLEDLVDDTFKPRPQYGVLPAQTSEDPPESLALMLPQSCDAKRLAPGVSTAFTRPQPLPGLMLVRVPWLVLVLVCLAFLVIGASAIYFGYSSSDVTFIDALYWSVLTCTTVGSSGALEAYFPTTTPGWKAFALAYSLVAVPSCFISVSGIAALALQAHSRRVEREIRSRVMPWEFLASLDADGTGVSKLEFVCAALMALDKVSPDDLWQVLDQFQQLDVDGGGCLCDATLAALIPSFSGVDEAKLAAAKKPRPVQATREIHCISQAPLLGSSRPEELQTFGVEKVVMQSSKVESSAVASDSGLPSAVERAPSALQESAVSSRRQSMVRFAPSVGEVLQSSEAHSTLRDGMETPSKSGANESMMTDLYQDMMRRQLEQKETELAAALRTQQKTEIDMRQVYAERQALHGEVTLLQHKLADLQVRFDEKAKQLESQTKRLDADLDKQQRLRSEADDAKSEQQRLCVEAERQRDDANRHREEAVTKMTEAQKRCSDLEAQARHADERAKASAQDAADSSRKLEASQQKLRLEADAKLEQLRKEHAELDFKRQGEMKSASLELQALAQGQHILRTHLRRTLTPPPALTIMPPVHQRLPSSRFALEGSLGRFGK